MRVFLRSLLLFFVVFFSCSSASAETLAEAVKMTSSTQFLWGDDWNGDGQSAVAQYVRFSFTPSEAKVSMAGYGRLWYNFGDSDILETNKLLGRLYYLYLDYKPWENSLVRVGRQFMNFSGGSSLMDGASVTLNNLGPVGVTAAAGRDVKYSLNSEYSASGNYFVGVDLHLVNVRPVQLGVSYVLKYDEWDTARQELGMNFRYMHRLFSPYAEARYDVISETFDEVTAGVDIFPLSNLRIKGEFYQSYPTFDSTSIYSVFAVDRYDEYLVTAEYSFDAPVTVFASYAHQTYEDDDNTDNYILGARYFPLKNLTLSAAVDYRNGYGGDLWGFEVTGDYKIKEKLLVSAGYQYNYYQRPDPEDDDFHTAQRLWIGGQYTLNKDLSVIARIEDNINVNFNHNPLGRVALNWNL